MAAQGLLPYLEAKKDFKRMQNPISHLFSKYLLTAYQGAPLFEALGI